MNLYWSLGYDFHLNDDLAFGVIGSYTEDLFVDRVNNILSERYGLVKNWVSGYPKGKVLIRNRNESSPFFLYLAYQNPKVSLEVHPKYENLYPNEKDPSRKTYLVSY